MVPKTNELLPEPDTPVNAVSRRLGISRWTSLRLFTRAPCTRIRSWLSAACVRVIGSRSRAAAGSPSRYGRRRLADEVTRLGGAADLGGDAVDGGQCRSGMSGGRSARLLPRSARGLAHLAGVQAGVAHGDPHSGPLL